MKDKDIYVEQVFIKKFEVKAGKKTVRDFDIACKSLFAKWLFGLPIAVQHCILSFACKAHFNLSNASFR